MAAIEPRKDHVHLTLEKGGELDFTLLDRSGQAEHVRIGTGTGGRKTR